MPRPSPRASFAFFRDKREAEVEVATVEVALAEKVVGWKLTNKSVLWISAVSFGVFVIAEIIGAVVGNSVALLGDAAAMSVDVNAYFTNLYAEYVKETYGTITLRHRIFIEAVIPMISAVGLIGVTTYVLIESIATLKNPSANDENVNVAIMFGFAAFNAAIDFLSLFLFWLRGSEGLSHDLVHDHGAVPNTESPVQGLIKGTALSSSAGAAGHQSSTDVELGHVHLHEHKAAADHRNHDHNHSGSCATGHEEEQLDHGHGHSHQSAPGSEDKLSKEPQAVKTSGARLEDETSRPSPKDVSASIAAAPDAAKNTNMMSALTHVSGDSLRTAAVFCAALITTLTHNPADVCDAVAGLIVSITIIGILYPLIREIIKNIRRILRQR
jgi:cation diffusion facilitator family transporter